MNTILSPVTAQRRIQHHRVTLNGSQPVQGLSSIQQEHTSILAALTIKIPPRVLLAQAGQRDPVFGLPLAVVIG